MNSEEFENLLKEAGLSKKRFSEIVGLNYNSVVNWNQNGFPSWVRTWLENYIKAKLFEAMAEKVRELDSKKS